MIKITKSSIYELWKAILDAGLADNIGNFQIQFHIIDSDSIERRAAIREKLSKTHTQQWCYDFVWDSWKLEPKGCYNLRSVPKLSGLVPLFFT